MIGPTGQGLASETDFKGFLSLPDLFGRERQTFKLYAHTVHWLNKSHILVIHVIPTDVRPVHNF